MPMKQKPSISLTKEQQNLVEDNVKLVYHYMNKRCLDSEEYEDLLYIALCKAAQTYDPSHNVKFSTYVYAIFSNEIRMAWRKDGGKRRTHNVFVISGDAPIFRKDGDECEKTVFDILDSNSTTIDDVITRADFDLFMKSLSERDRNIITLRLNGYAQTQIAKTLGYSQSYVARILAKCLRAFINRDK